MTLLDRYIGRSVGLGFLAAAALLLPLFGFLDLIGELDDVGDGRYQLAQALLVSVMRLPGRAVDMAPFIALLGGIVGLGQLAANAELTAARAAGITVARIGMTALTAGAVLIAMLAIVDQWLAAPLEQRALNVRAAAISASRDTIVNDILWARKDDRMLRVGAFRGGQVPADIEIFRFGADRRLLRYVQAEFAEVRADGTWLLHEVRVKRWRGTQTSVRRLDRMSWESIVSESRLSELALPPASLSPLQLYHHVRFLQAAGQSASVYEVILWQKAAQPVLIAAMILLSVPFAMGHTRGGGLGGRLALGVVTGLAVFMINQIAGALGILFHLNPALVGILPGMVLLVAAIFLLRRLSRGD